VTWPANTRSRCINKALPQFNWRLLSSVLKCQIEAICTSYTYVWENWKKKNIFRLIKTREKSHNELPQCCHKGRRPLCAQYELPLTGIVKMLVCTENRIEIFLLIMFKGKQNFQILPLWVQLFSGPLTVRKTSRPWSMSRGGQQSWWGVWSTSLMRNSWGNWDCLVRRRGSGGPYCSLQLPEGKL